MQDDAKRAAKKLEKRIRQRKAHLAQRRQAAALLKDAGRLISQAARGSANAAREIKERCAESLAFRRAWSTVNAERTKGIRRPVPDSFTPKGLPLNGGRVNPR